MSDLATSVLYYGDNLDILRRYRPDATHAQLAEPILLSIDPNTAPGGSVVA